MTTLRSTFQLFILALVFALASCGGGDKKASEENATDSTEKKATTDVGTETKTTESADNNKETTTDNSNAAYANYGIEEYYKLWLKAERERMGDAAKDAPEGKINVKDIANGYMKVTGTLSTMGFHTMTLWKAKNGKATLGVIMHGCGPLCGPGPVQFFEIKDGKLSEVTEDIFPMNKQTELSKKCVEKNKDKMPTTPGVTDGCWTSLPQIGTSIKMGFAKTDAEYKTTFTDLIAELQYNVEDGTFKLVEK